MNLSLGKLKRDWSTFHITRFFRTEEPLLGLSITPASITLSWTKTIRDRRGVPPRTVIVTAQELLPARTIIRGMIADKKNFVEAIHKLLSGKDIPTLYTIASIPDAQIYTKTLSFPQGIEGDRFDEALDLALTYQLPQARETIYADTEKRISGDHTEALATTVPRPVIDAYTEALTDAGLRPIAIEHRALTLARVLNIPPEKSFLITTRDTDGTVHTIINEHGLQFLRTVPFGTTEDPEEERKLGDFYEAARGRRPETIVLNNLPLKPLPEGLSYEGSLRDPLSTSLVLRGRTPRKKDTYISLLPVGTEEAYQYQRASLFIDFVSTSTISIAVFFLLVFGSGYGLMINLQSQSSSRVQVLVRTPQDGGALRQERARELGTFINLADTFIAQSPRFSVVIDELISKTDTGIILSSVGIGSVVDQITLSGIAKTRADLNAFRRTLQTNPLWSEVDLPLTNLELKETIPFSITMRISDPALVLGIAP